MKVKELKEIIPSAEFYEINSKAKYIISISPTEHITPEDLQRLINDSRLDIDGIIICIEYPEAFRIWEIERK